MKHKSRMICLLISNETFPKENVNSLGLKGLKHHFVDSVIFLHFSENGKRIYFYAEEIFLRTEICKNAHKTSTKFVCEIWTVFLVGPHRKQHFDTQYYDHTIIQIGLIDLHLTYC